LCDIDTLDLLVYKQDIVLLAAYELYRTDRSANFDEFVNTLTHILSVRERNDMVSYQTEVNKCFQLLRRQNEVSLAGNQYLQTLLQCNDHVLMASFAHFEFNQDGSELLDTLTRLSRRWRRLSPHSVLLALLDYLADNGLLAKTLWERYCFLVYKEDPVLLAAFELYLSSQEFDEEAAWAEFSDTLVQVGRRVLHLQLPSPCMMCDV